jgi:hypothetical protein
MYTPNPKTSLSPEPLTARARAAASPFLPFVLGGLLAFAASCSSSSPANPDGGGAGASGTTGGAGGAGAAECSSNAECASSEAAMAVAQKKCLDPEVYCLAGTCVGACADTCVVARADFDPCQKGLCAPSPYEGSKNLSFCTMLPVKCATADDCPKVLPPPPDGGAAAWTCESGICRYPGFEYATH